MASENDDYKKTSKLYEIKEKYGISDNDPIFAILEANDDFLSNLNDTFRLSSEHKKVVEDVSKNIDSIRKLKLKNMLILGLASLGLGIIVGLFVSNSKTVLDLMNDYQMRQERQLSQVPVQLQEQQHVFDKKIEKLKAEHLKKKNELKMQIIALKEDKKDAFKKLKAIKSSNKLAEQLSELGVTFTLVKNSYNTYTLRLNRESVQEYMFRDIDTEIKFKIKEF